jgi:hypothetical protein
VRGIIPRKGLCYLTTQSIPPSESFRQQGIDAKVKFLGVPNMGADQFVIIGGKAVEGSVYVADYFPGMDTAENKRFVESYRKKYNRSPDNGAALGYTAVEIAAATIKAAGANPTHDSIRAALENTKELPVILGRGKFSFDAERGAQYQGVIFAACRRVARAIYMGSAPLTQAAHRGLEDRRIKLGCVMPGESPAVFGDALRRLAGAATYLYQDGPRYWYSTQPTVTKLADDRVEQLKRDTDKVVRELDLRLRENLEQKGDFSRIHPMPQSGQDVPDDLDARLVVLGVDHAYSKEPSSAAETAAKAIFESRGNSPRLYRNTLVFLAADKTRLQDLDEATRRYLAWESILTEKVTLNLDPQQVKQAETQMAAADGAVTARLPETYQWLLVPGQATPQAAVEWQAIRLSGQDALAVRASKKLRSEELLLTGFAATRLRMELDRVPLWRADHVAIKQLVEDFARYLYLPRIKEPGVLLQSIRDGLGLLTWNKDSFAFAESYDETAGRYRGLRCGQMVAVSLDDPMSLLVKPEIAQKQTDVDSATTSSGTTAGGEAVGPSPGGQTTVAGGVAPGWPIGPPPAPARPKRFHGTVTLDAARVGRDAGRIADEVIAHLSGLVGSSVKVTLEIEADVPGGVPENVVQTVTENSRTLKFSSHGFEKE